jgi:thiamine biosynthesis lipoprotein
MIIKNYSVFKEDNTVKQEANDTDNSDYYLFEEPLVGATIKFTIYAANKDAVELIRHDLVKEAQRLEKIFSFYNPKSELSQLNSSREMNVSSQLLEVVKKALIYTNMTNGEYDIALGRVILARKKGEEIDSTNIPKNLYKDITIEGNRVSLKNDFILIDLGSIAKGYIADKLVEFLQNEGIESGIVDARGDLRIFGDATEECNIQHPRDKDKLIEPFALNNCSVATSGDYNQFYGSTNNSHILNSKELISVTVIADTLMEADALASAVFVSDEKVREEIIKNVTEKDRKTTIRPLVASQSPVKILTIDKKLNINKYNWSFE